MSLASAQSNNSKVVELAISSLRMGAKRSREGAHQQVLLVPADLGMLKNILNFHMRARKM
jgi:hypothetical protein